MAVLNFNRWLSLTIVAVLLCAEALAGDAPKPVITVTAAVLEPEKTAGNEIELKATVVAKQLKPNQPHALVHIEGIFKDFYGTEVPESHLAFDVTVKQGETKTESCIVKPGPRNVGPYFFTGTWVDKEDGINGDLSGICALANSRSMIDDFEQPHFKIEKNELEYSFSAQYRIGWQGHNGLDLHLPKQVDAGGKTASKLLTYNVPLPGRAAKLGFFIHAFGNLQVSATIQDSSGAVRTVGPVNLPQSDWRFAELPIAPAAKPGEDYRLTLKELIFHGPPGSGLYIDDLVVLTQRDSQLTVSAGSAVPFTYSGAKIRADGTPERFSNRLGQTTVFGACTGPLQFKLSAAAFGKDRPLHFTGTVTDYHGVVLPKVEVDIEAKAGQTTDQNISVTTTEQNAGPYYINGTWTEVNSDNRDTLFETVGQANWRSVIEDFEQIKFTEAGGALENSPTAKHSGELGLIVRPRPPVPLPGAPPPPPDAAPVTTIPLNMTLTGRATKLGMWVKAPTTVQIRMQVRDPGINHMGGMFYDTWVVGPVSVSAGDWQYVELPMPDLCAPEAKRKKSCESNGILDYPLTLENISISGPLNAEICIDDIELWSQTEKENAIVARAFSNKSSGLLYRNDSIAIVLGNAWLWGEPLKVSYDARLENLFGKQLPLLNESAAVAAGTQHVQRVAVNNLPVGPYAFKLEARAGGAVIATLPPPKTAENPHPELNFLVYEPQGKPLPPPELYALVRNRDKLVAELGFTTDNLLFKWHSTQNDPAIENFPGYFYFDWLDPQIKKRKDAGLNIIGTLGFTPQFYDPSGRFITVYSEWFGSTVAMPSRSVYFEEYAHRTIENFAGEVDTWVVWDRPDNPNFATAEDYTDRMLEVARHAANEANPKAKLISGAIPFESINTYLTNLIEAGGHNYVDGIGIMPAPAPLSPEDGNLDAVLARTQRLRKQEQVKPELWVLNLAWSTGDTQGSVSEINQALYIPRAWVMCRAQGINQIFVQPDGTKTTAEKNSADLIYPSGDGFAIKPAAIATKTVSAVMKDAVIVREIFLNDRWEGLTRSYLFKRPDGKLVLALWRREGSSALQLATRPEAVYDTFGNTVDLGESQKLTLRPAPQYAIFGNIDANALIKQLERADVAYEDAKESAWKMQFSFHLDVGDPEDEKAAQYSSTDSHLVGPIDSYYYSDYGRHVIDSGRHFKGQESFVVDVSRFGDADMILRKRINFSVRNQLVKVYCNDQYVGQWCAPLCDRRYRWRDLEYVIPNSFFAGKTTAALKFVNAGEAEATSYYYWAGPLHTKKIYGSDLSLLTGTAGPAAPFINRDRNIIGMPMTLPKQSAPFSKGIGTNSGKHIDDSIVVLCLNKQYKKLHAVVGIDTCTNGRGSVQFKIAGLNKKVLFDSKYMSAFTEPKSIDIDVSDQIAVMLWVDDGNDGMDDDIANWADLQLELK